jgi:uncharacterized protein (TIGR02284 family)
MIVPILRILSPLLDPRPVGRASDQMRRKRGLCHQFIPIGRIVASPRALKRRNLPDGREETKMDNQDQISTLNTLISTLIDSATGYEDAASNSEADRFQELFRERATERSRVVEDLRSEVRRLGGNPEDDGSFLGKTHQRFLDLKAAVTGRDDQSIINEVERGEDYLKEKFETALEGDTLTGECRAVVERAYQSVRQGHDQISQLKHGLEA